MLELNKKDDSMANEESIKNLLILSLLKDGVNPKLISLATGIPEKTIRNKFPMGLIKSDKE